MEERSRRFEKPPSLTSTQSREPSALHHLPEFIEVNPPVAVDVDLHDHLLAVLDRPALLEAERREHGAELVDCDEPVAVLIEDVEGLAHVLVLVPPPLVLHYGRVELPELLDVEAAVPVGVDLLDHLRQLLLRDVDPQLLHRLAQLLPADLAVAVAVEHAEHPLQLRRIHGYVGEFMEVGELSSRSDLYILYFVGV